MLTITFIYYYEVSKILTSFSFVNDLIVRYEELTIPILLDFSKIKIKNLCFSLFYSVYEASVQKTLEASILVEAFH